ncbi:hypothetical protein BV22DRAFT_1098083 [Leucogyrophana mollusca]|uniref:Uncharacterized protein n=1 Tax=Leucogyrophana mollusca TaxID=85980 RepID=A0ACB8B4I9_9AGAM|nr:hypothetical protein BV22DRAFT_1098083 [Leucogyrophana mollusca]
MTTIEIAGGTLVELSFFYSAMYWGFVLSTSLVGISLVQVYMYYMRHNNDRWQMKALVASLLFVELCLFTLDGFLTIHGCRILDPATSILMAETIYYYFVVNFGVPQALASIPISWVLETGLTVLVTSIVQIYFAINIYWIHKRTSTIPGGLLIPAVVFTLAFAAFVSGIVTTVLTAVQAINSFAEASFQIAVITEETFAAVADILSTSTLCYVLSRPRVGTTAASRLKSIFLFLVNRGILVTLIQIGMLVAYLSARTYLYWTPFHLCKSKLYTNTLRARLNSPNQEEEVPRTDEATRSLAPWGVPIINLTMKEEDRGVPSVSTAEVDAEKSVQQVADNSEMPDYPPSTLQTLSAGPS